MRDIIQETRENKGMKCKGCGEEFEEFEIDNYVVTYESWEAFNCCSKGCARKCAKSDGIDDDEIISIE